MTQITKAFTFIGMGELNESRYTYQQQSHETCFMADAIVRFFEPKELVLIATEASKNKTVSKKNKEGRVAYLEEMLGDKTKIEVITIPEGKSEAELWEIFNQLADSVEDEECILFDITHAFRFLPLLSLTMITYIRLVKPSVTIEKIIYGAYGGTDSQIIDLTLFLDLMSWIDAVSTFKSSGDLSKVSELLENRHNEVRRQANPSDHEADMPVSMSKLAKLMRNASQGLKFNRLEQVQKDSAISVQLLKNTESEIKRWAQPFSRLIDSVVAELEPLSVNCQIDVKDDHNLQAQYRHILWYEGKKQFTHVFLLAREWLVSVSCKLMGLNWKDFNEREKVERELNQSHKYRINGKQHKIIFSVTLLDAWDKVKSTRNDLAHFGMGRKSNPLKAKDLEKEAKKTLEQLAKVNDELSAISTVNQSESRE